MIRGCDEISEFRSGQMSCPGDTFVKFNQPETLLPWIWQGFFHRNVCPAVALSYTELGGTSSLIPFMWFQVFSGILQPLPQQGSCQERGGAGARFSPSEATGRLRSTHCNFLKIYSQNDFSKTFRFGERVVLFLPLCVFIFFFFFFMQH